MLGRIRPLLTFLTDGHLSSKANAVSLSATAVRHLPGLLDLCCPLPVYHCTNMAMAGQDEVANKVLRRAQVSKVCLLPVFAGLGQGVLTIVLCR